MSERDRRRMAVMARDLATIETNEEPVEVERTLSAIDADRARRGIDPLLRDEPLPEEELYRRARALGLRRSSR